MQGVLSNPALLRCARNCGLPVAAFTMGAAREILGEAGAYADCGDVAGLACAIDTALALPRDVPHRRVATHFTHDLWLDRCEALYAEARRGDDRLAA